MRIHGRNFRGRDPAPDEVPDGSTLVRCNMARPAPGTPVLVGRKGLTLIGCNCARAVLPADAKLIDCNTSQRPLPPHAEPEEMIEIERSEYDVLLADRRKLRALEKEARHD